MNRDIFISQLNSARDLEDKFILSFGSFLQKHVSDNYNLTEAQREFVDKRVQILLADSKRHLNLFTTMLGEVERHQDMVL